jgi:hypothetical protein
MASIVSLVRNNPQPAANRTGNIVTATETWCMVTNTIASQIEAESLLSSIREGNQYSWIPVGVVGHPDNSSLYSTGFTVERVELRSVQFLVTVSFTNEINEINENRSALDADPVYDYPEVDTLIEVDVDPLTGVAIASSNGEAYFPKVQRKGTDTRILISRNELRFDPRQAKNYRNKLNKTAMNIDGRSYDERTLLLESWTGKSAVDVDGAEYYQVRYQFLYDPEGHKIQLIDVASRADKDGRYPQASGRIENKPYKLGRDEEGDGKYMRKDDQEDPTKFFIREFNVHEEINMRFLRL